MISERSEERSLKTSKEKYFNLPKNIFHMLTNQHSFLSIRDEVRQKKAENDIVQIMATMPDEENVHQLWMIKPVNHKKVELVHFYTDDVVDCEGEDIRLTRGRQKI